MSLSSNLYRLQQIDTQLDLTRHRLGEIEKILNDSSALDEAIEKAASSEQSLSLIRSQLRDIEIQVQSQKNKIEQCESTLYGGRVRNPKELQDLQNEAASLKRYLSTLEDRQLDAMLAVEDSEEAHQANALEIEKVRGQYEEIYAGLRGEKTALLSKEKSLEQERMAAASMIAGQDQTLYDQLRRTRSGVAVARIIDKSCSACGSTLTPALVQSASLSTQYARCSSCSRILFAG